MLAPYMNMNAFVAGAGIVVTIAALILWEWISVEILIYEWAPTTEHLLIVTAAGLGVAGFTSNTRNLEDYNEFEIGVVGVGIVGTVGAHYWTYLSDLVAQHTALQVLGFVVTFTMWLVVAR